MIVVTAPTGNIGRHVVRDLVAAGAPVRVIVRDRSRLAAGVDAVEVVEGSHGDPAVLDSALDGADALFWLAPPNPRQTLEATYIDFTRPAVEAVRRHGVGHLVGVTALGRGTAWEGRAGLVTASIRMDDLLMTTGAAFRGLAMPAFMDNTLQQAGSIRTQATMFGPIGADKTAPITAARDIGAVAAGLLADLSWTGQEDLPVLGPEDLSMNEMAAVVSEVLGRPVRYQQVPFEAFQAQLAGQGMNDSFVRGFVDMMRAKDEGMDVEAGRAATTRTPTTFRRWCEDALKPALAA